ncbi:hypothetical protein [Virgibacillus dokdonensis]
MTFYSLSLVKYLLILAIVLGIETVYKETAYEKESDRYNMG